MSVIRLKCLGPSVRCVEDYHIMQNLLLCALKGIKALNSD
jgi:hypothetical protein